MSTLKLPPIDNALTKQAGNNGGRSKLIVPFLCLLLIEVIAFGINIKHVGIYQDEWITFEKLHFTPHSLSQLIYILLVDPRVIVRPLEALHFGPLFYFVWEKPLWYHIICYLSEFLSGWFLFLALNRLNGDRIIALATAILFLLYPTHDVTHYEIVASSLPISMAFFTASLWLYLKGFDEKRYQLICCSALAYFFSIFNYEFCLPLAILYPLFYLLKMQPLHRWQDLFRTDHFLKFFLYQILFVIATTSMLIYRCYLLPLLGLDYYRYATTFDLGNFFSVLWAGFVVSLSPYTLQFCTGLFLVALKEGLTISYLAALSLAMLTVYICLRKENWSSHLPRTYLHLLFLGFTTILFSYTIYGLSPEHKPVIDAWLNRVNLGGALGACLVISACFGLLLHSTKINLTSSTKQTAFAIFISIFVGVLIIINWQFAKPWIVSWQAQKALMNVLKEKAGEIKPGDSIIIGGITRYASKWTPVVDGHWDFQGIVRTTLNSQQIKATVVTERLSISQNQLIDKYNNIILGEFPFAHMILFSPTKKRWLRISSRQEFIEKKEELDWQIPCR